MCDFNEKTVVVTGAGSGIGRATAIAFGKAGANVVVADINEENAAKTAAEIGSRALAFKVDVGDEAQCQAMIAATVNKFGRLDVLFNNAGIGGQRARIADMPTEEWLKVININLNSLFYCTKAAIPEMKKVGGGVIINTASVDGLMGMATISHYVSAKHAVIGLSKTCALEYAADNIRCLAICPGFVETPMVSSGFTKQEAELIKMMTPLGRAADPSEIANVVVFLASEKASFMTGSFLQIDGGVLAGVNFPS
ncbi:MAG: SDR family oxidoreductase [Deltaproteobacteria bacterium]|nr:SDR family oxidoreductase [Deltaproteobacteria bacterium]